jgi:small multidrug resistance pump
VSHAAALAVLFVAICLEVTGTAALQASQQFTRLWPTVLMGCCYAGSLFLLSVTLKVMPVGIAYAIWSGVGIVLIALIGYAVFGQKLDMPAVMGLALIVAGVVVVNVFSNTIMH